MIIKKLAGFFATVNNFNDPLRNGIWPINNRIHFSTGALGVFYQAGIAKFLKERYDTEYYHYSGVSAGAWCATLLASNISTTEMDETLGNLSLAVEDSNKFWVEGPFIAKDLIASRDIAIDLSRLQIGITQFTPWPNKNYVYEFTNNEDVLDACIASSHIPVLSGRVATRYKETFSMDGAIMGNNPPNDNYILDFSPDIWGRVYTNDVLFTFHADNMLNMYNDGYEDTKKMKKCLDQLIAKKPKTKKNDNKKGQIFRSRGWPIINH
tara:strand:+ start:724 stop:1521 length:798 start_codon:yes stop_codon:yes gene_type:complete